MSSVRITPVYHTGGHRKAHTKKKDKGVRQKLGIIPRIIYRWSRLQESIPRYCQILLISGESNLPILAVQIIHNIMIYPQYLVKEEDTSHPPI